MLWYWTSLGKKLTKCIITGHHWILIFHFHPSFVTGQYTHTGRRSITVEVLLSRDNIHTLCADPLQWKYHCKELRQGITHGHWRTCKDITTRYMPICLMTKIRTTKLCSGISMYIYIWKLKHYLLDVEQMKLLLLRPIEWLGSHQQWCDIRSSLWCQ
jgi:hypothetical protein